MYTTADFEALASLLSENARTRYPAPPILMPGDLAWRLPDADSGQNLKLFRRDGRLVGYAWFEPLTGFEFDIRISDADQNETVRHIFSWAEKQRRSLPPAYPRFIDITDMQAWRREVEAPEQKAEDNDCYLTCIALESDAARVSWLDAHGYSPTAHFSPVYFRDLSEDVPEAELPSGTRLRSVTSDDLENRVDVHRAAWAGSTFDINRYQQIRSSPAYNARLDIVLEEVDTSAGDSTAHSSFAGYCICWADEVSGIGLFEPVGTRDSWRGRGVARAVILEGFRRLKAAGMRVARVSTPCFNAPAQALYTSCGFKQVDTERTYIRKIG